LAIRLNKKKYLLSIAFLIYLSKSSVALANENDPEWGPWSVSPSSPVVKESVVKNISVNDADTRFSSTKLPFIWALNFYRKFISPVSGNRCQMSPSCSHYSLLAFKKHGPILGAIMTADRLMRCNPSCAESHILVFRGGRYRCYDPVENNDFWFAGSANSNPPEAE
jgi:putative membrane protein insertion efficiency factor